MGFTAVHHRLVECIAEVTFGVGNKRCIAELRRMFEQPLLFGILSVCRLVLFMPTINRQFINIRDRGVAFARHKTDLTELHNSVRNRSGKLLDKDLVNWQTVQWSKQQL